MRYSFGLGESSLDHRRREEFPAIFTIVNVLEELMKELSVFIDEKVSKIHELIVSYRKRGKMKNFPSFHVLYYHKMAFFSSLPIICYWLYNQKTL